MSSKIPTFMNWKPTNSGIIQYTCIMLFLNCSLQALWVAVVLNIKYMKILYYLPEFIGFHTGGIFDISLVMNFLILKKNVFLLPGFPKSRPKRSIFCRKENLTGSAECRFPLYILLKLTWWCECCCCCNGGVLSWFLSI